jgi:PTH1 family peptidyl-tRNA hydrolase
MSLFSTTPTILLAGLGNPGREYRSTRHNIGFLAMDHLGASLGLTFSKRQADALVAIGRLEKTRLILAKPQTYMNLVGRSVSGLARFYKIPPASMVLVCDDLDLPLGTLRFRPAGGTAGHKGLDSSFAALGTQEVPRLRLGIGRPPGRMDPADYVLQEFGGDEQLLLQETLERATACLRAFVLEGPATAMNRFNGPADGA